MWMGVILNCLYGREQSRTVLMEGNTLDQCGCRRTFKSRMNEWWHSNMVRMEENTLDIFIKYNISIVICIQHNKITCNTYTLIKVKNKVYQSNHYHSTVFNHSSIKRTCPLVYFITFYWLPDATVRNTEPEPDKWWAWELTEWRWENKLQNRLRLLLKCPVESFFCCHCIVLTPFSL